MSKPKFKVGQNVVAAETENTFDGHGITKGQTYTVSVVDDDETLQVKGSHHWFGFDQFKPLRSTPVNRKAAKEPKLKLMPLPKGLPKLPEGSVYLGFNIPEQPKKFKGWTFEPVVDDNEWDKSTCNGGFQLHYAAPANSAIAKKILGTVTPAKKATKTVTKSRKTVTKSAKAKKTVTKDAPSRTYRDALNELPEPYRSQAIENIENMREPGYLDRETSLGGRVILGHAFCWANAPQGHDYWEAVHEDRTPPCETPKYRYFKDDNGVRWRMPVNGSLGETMVPGKTIWESVLSALQDIEYDIEDGSNGTIETDEHGNPLTPEPTSEVNLSSETDAVVWAKEWLRIIGQNPSIPTDEGTMIGRFANAIMAGFDEGRRRSVSPALSSIAQESEKHEPVPPTLPEVGMPPIPAGYRFAGQLKDYQGEFHGKVWEKGDNEWSHDATYSGMADFQDCDSATWYLCAKEEEPPTKENGPEAQEEVQPNDPYAVTIGGVLADPYRIARAYGITDPVIFQALKKLLRFGCKHKEAAADVREAITSLERWEAMNKEDES